MTIRICPCGMRSAPCCECSCYQHKAPDCTCPCHPAYAAGCVVDGPMTPTEARRALPGLEKVTRRTLLEDLYQRGRS